MLMLGSLYSAIDLSVSVSACKPDPRSSLMYSPASVVAPKAGSPTNSISEIQTMLSPFDSVTKIDWCYF